LEKPAKCPECGSARIADILYGLIAVSEKLEAEIKAWRITPGGCCVDEPIW